jgi:hypothetical protein
MALAFGYLPCCAAIPWLLWALLALDRFLEQPSSKGAGVLALAALAVALCDAGAWLWLAVAGVTLAAGHGWHPRRIAAAVALQLPATALGAWQWTLPARAAAPPPVREELIRQLQQMPTRVIAGSSEYAAQGALIALGLIWMALLLSARTDARDSEASQHGFAYRLELLVLVAIAYYFFFPLRLMRVPDSPPFSARYLPLAALLAALLPHGEVVGRRRWLLIPVCAIAVFYPLMLATSWVQFDHTAASFRRLIARVERGASTLTLVGPDHGEFELDRTALPYLHYHAYAQMSAGGFDPWLPPELPLAERPGAALPAPASNQPATQTLEHHGAHYDYVLTKGEPRPFAYFGPNDAPRAPLVASDGDWRLYKVKHP